MTLSEKLRYYLLSLFMLMLGVNPQAQAEMNLEPGTTVIFYHYDLLGSPVMVSDHKGKTLWFENTKPFGESTGKFSPGGMPHQDNLFPESVSEPGYTGHTEDRQTGLTYMKARYYDPVVGRFYSNDPVGFLIDSPLSFNRYSYVSNNPYRYTDPTGMQEQEELEREIAESRTAEYNVSAVWDGFKSFFASFGGGSNSDTGTWSEGYEADDVAEKVVFGALFGGVSKLKKVAKRGLPTNPDDLLKRGYKETTHPEAAKRGHRTFENSDGDKVRFDQGKPGKNGFEGRGHYHRYNPDATSKRNQYLDKNGNPCARGCDASHLLPGD